MAAPQPINDDISISHIVFLIWSGSGTIKQSLKDYGISFDTEVGGDTVHCIMVDPRFGHDQIRDYIEELGGVVYRLPAAPEQ